MLFLSNIHYLLVVMILIPKNDALWFSLGLPTFKFWSPSSSSPTQLIEQNQFCSSLTFLTIQQRLLCQTNPKIFAIIHRSLRLALDECHYQFRHQRWNCSLFDHSNFLGKLIQRKTPETAFIYALTSAAVMHNIAKACSKGELTECGCDKTQPKIRSRSTLFNASTDGFEWGGCSADLKFARNVSQSFLDQQEQSITRRKIGRLVNLHNNEAGRQAIERNVQLTCKCHGVSGSCTLRVCWRTLPEFRLIGSELRTKYVSATQVRLHRQLTPRKVEQKLFNITDLVYLQTSPSYCERNLRLGSLGTQGRECHNVNSCSVLCCDRGYETIVSTIEEDCDCQFHWCCEVRCKRCVKKIERHFCK